MLLGPAGVGADAGQERRAQALERRSEIADLTCRVGIIAVLTAPCRSS